MGFRTRRTLFERRHRRDQRTKLANFVMAEKRATAGKKWVLDSNVAA